MFLSNSIIANAQSIFIKGKIINQFTNETMPFASVFWKKAGFGVIADSVGFFSIKKSSYTIDTIVASYIGYEEIYHPYQVKTDTGIILLTFSNLKLANDVTVKSKFNKGLRWWKSIVAHKKENDPYQFNNYSYELYNKLELDLNNIDRKSFESNKMLKPFAFVLKNIDSSETKPFLPIFLTESISDYYYSNEPNKIREEIKALQTSGIKNETVMQFMGGVSQKINVYENYITVFKKEFISPISSQGDKFYNYKGADTQIINHEKYFHLFFSPKQDGSNTFSGDCWIHSNTWAIQRINLNISPTANINFVNRLSIIQEFSKTGTGKWIFAKDKFIADLSPLNKNQISFIGRKTATYRNVHVDDPMTETKLSKNKTKEEVIILDSSRSYSYVFWDTNRHEPLSLTEQKVYTMIDTLKSMPLFVRYSNNLEFLVDGHRKFGKIEIGPWFKWISGNQLEKIRLRFDIGTTKLFSEHLRLNGYLAYGIKDGVWKGKAAAEYKFSNPKGVNIFASYTNDLDNGRIRYNDDDDATTDNMFSQLIRRQHIRQKFLGTEAYKFGVSNVWANQISTEFSFNNSDYHTFGYLPSQVFFSRNGQSVINSELDLKIRFAPGEKEIQTHRRTIHMKSSNPVFEAKYGIAFPNIFLSEYSYQKVTLSIKQTIQIPRWGHIDYLIYGGKYFGDSIPFMLLEIHPGNEIYYYNKQSFNLMNRFEYFSDQYAGFNLEYNFEKKLINLVPFLRKSKVRQFINIKTVRGDLNSANRIFNRLEFADYRLKRLRGENYTEIGTGIDNLFKFFRIDLVWRLAPTFVAPPTSTVPNNPQNFAVFGSFRLQF
ncbi:MAG: DUF5686 family protein [Bacteroidetes bacterium]|nr:DUF5686 family protein [Bacteroidota bacterium]